MCVCVCTCVWVWVGSQEVDTRVPACINTSYESTANASMCIDSLVAVHYDATSHGTLGCHRPLYATMLQAAQCYCGSWCGLWLTVPPPSAAQEHQQAPKSRLSAACCFCRHSRNQEPLLFTSATTLRFWRSATYGGIIVAKPISRIT